MAPDSFALRGRFANEPAASGSERDQDTPLPFRSWWTQSRRAIWREPLLHFIVLGGVIFAADAVLHPPSRDERVITVTNALRRSFIENFDEDKEHGPTDAELRSMIDAWVASEILYREGKALGLDRGDETIRDRIAFKLQLLIFDQAEVNPPAEAELREWFAANHARFDQPERVSFYLSPPYSENEALERLAAMRQGREPEELRSRTRAMIARPVSTLATSFGAEFRDGLLALHLEDWAVLPSTAGWHLVRLDAHHDAEPARFEDVRDQAVRLWHTEKTRERAWQAVERLKSSYTIRYES
jgi:hypothetical protein